MRQVAVALKIDLNTVQRAYAELEREGVLTMQRGVGTFVDRDAAAAQCRANRCRTSPAASPPRPRAQGIALDELAEALTRLAGRTG